MRKMIPIAGLFLLVSVLPGHAQTGLTAVTAANGISVGGKPIAAGKVLLTPVDVKGQPISFVSGGGGGLNAPKAFSCTITSGVITPSCQVPDACLTTPANILYNIDVTATANFVTFRLPTVVNICGTSWPLDQYAPPAHTTTTQAMLVAYGTAAPPNPCANATMYVQNASGGLLWICVNSVPVEVTGGGSGGAVDTIGIAPANGVSGTSSGGSAPLLTITLGDITPTSVTVTDSTKPTQTNYTPTTHPTIVKAGAASVGVDTVTTAGVYLLPQAPGSGVYTGANTAGKVATTFTPLQGTDAKVLSAGTVSGTSAALCTDAQGGATTVSCPAAGATVAHTTNVVKGDNAGNAVAATPGTDYVIPSGNAATATLAANSSAVGGVALTGLCQTGGAGCPASGGSSAGPLGAVQVAGASGAFVQAVGDVNYQSVTSTPLSGSQGSLQVIANSVVDQMAQYFTSDGTPYWCAGLGYCSLGVFAEDYTYSLIQNPSKFPTEINGVAGTSTIRNIVSKFIAQVDVHGQIPAAINSAGTGASVTYSGWDNNHAFYSGVAMYMIPLDCYVDWQKTGSTSCYTTYVNAIKTAQAYSPINGTSHLPTNVVGANEWMPQSLFLEEERSSGDVANASVLRAASDAVMSQMATAAGDSTNATFFSTDFTNVTTSIQSEFIDPTSHMLWAGTGQNKQIDMLTSGMAVWLSRFTGQNILTLAQQKAIGTFLHTNLATINYNGFFANTVTTGGAVTTWTTKGIIPSGGGGSGYTSDGCAAGVYQQGYWSLVTGMNAYALSLTNPTDVPTLLASFRDAASGASGDPAWEYYDQAHGHSAAGCSPAFSSTATTPNTESPQGAAWAAANIVGPTAIPAGLGVTDKYGALVSLATTALPNGTTAATQTVGDNSTKVATDAFVLANAAVVSGTSPIVVTGPVISCPTCSVGSGTNVQVNGGSTLGTANLNATTPAAPGGNTNVTFQVSGTNVSAYVPTGGGGGGNYVNLCATVTLSSGATCSGGAIAIVSGTASVTISAIPGTFLNLIIDVNEYSTSGSAANLLVQFNGDVGSNYTYQQTHSQSSSVSAFNGAGITTAAIGAVGTSIGGSAFTINIPFYSKTINKLFNSVGGQYSSLLSADNYIGFWNSTAAITSITFTLSGGNFGTGFMSIYGTN